MLKHTMIFILLSGAAIAEPEHSYSFTGEKKAVVHHQTAETVPAPTYWIPQERVQEHWSHSLPATRRWGIASTNGGVAVRATAVRSAAVRFSAPRFSAVRASAVRASAVRASAVRATAVRASAVRASAVRFSAVRGAVVRPTR